MIDSYSARPARIRRATWHRRHDRRKAGMRSDSLKAVRPLTTRVALLVRSSRGDAGDEANRDATEFAESGATIEIVVNAETRVIEYWSIRTFGFSIGEFEPGSSTMIAPAP